MENKKPVTCGWCQQPPRVAVTDEEATFCQSEGCPNYSVGHDGVEIWNQVQRSILARRRKDFEEGKDLVMSYAYAVDSRRINDACLSDFERHLAKERDKK